MKTVNWLVVVCCALVLAIGSTSAIATIVDPTDLDNLQLWLDANDPDGDGTAGGVTAGQLATWVDKSGNVGRDASQATADSQPALTTGADGINNLPVVRFDAVDDYLMNTDVNYSAKTVFIVYRVTNVKKPWSTVGAVQRQTVMWRADGRGAITTGSWSFDGNSGKQAYYSVNGDELVDGGGGSSAQTVGPQRGAIHHHRVSTIHSR